jgi:tetratricopeptide (TPR) repeat protein
MESILEMLAVAIKQQQAGKITAAEAIYQQILQHDPQNVAALNALGAIAHQRGEVSSATAYFQQSLAVQPTNPDGYNGLGIVLQAQGWLDEAIDCYQRALTLKETAPEFHNNLGSALQAKGFLAEAIVHYQHALGLDPEFAEAWSNLSAVLALQSDYSTAIAHCCKALFFQPQRAALYDQLGNLYQQQGCLEEAAGAYEQAIALQPTLAAAHNHLGNTRQQQGQFAAALDHFQQALRLKPDFAEAYNNLGIALRQCRQVEASIAAYEQAIALHPNFVEAHWNKALSQLLLGDLQAGFVGYNWRLQWEPFRLQPPLTQPPWDGTPLLGKTIFLYAEQGLGDTVQFIRYVPLVAQLGGRVIVQCQPSLVALLATVTGIQQILPSGALLPPFDVQASLMSLPGLLGTTLETIPNQVPYLKLPQANLSVAIPPGTRIKIGIVWTGNPDNPYNPYRSCPLSYFLRGLELPGVALYSLQHEVPIADRDLFDQSALQDVGSHLLDFIDTAAAIAQMDLIVSIDTAVAHLAGALGKPVWLVLPFVPDWRWMLDRSNSPWYPTFRLFRQQAWGDWASVFEQVNQALHTAAAKIYRLR